MRLQTAFKKNSEMVRKVYKAVGARAVRSWTLQFGSSAKFCLSSMLPNGPGSATAPPLQGILKANPPRQGLPGELLQGSGLASKIFREASKPRGFLGHQSSKSAGRARLRSPFESAKSGELNPAARGAGARGGRGRKRNPGTRPPAGFRERCFRSPGSRPCAARRRRRARAEFQIREAALDFCGSGKLPFSRPNSGFAESAEEIWSLHSAVHETPLQASAAAFGGSRAADFGSAAARAFLSEFQGPPPEPRSRRLRVRARSRSRFGRGRAKILPRKFLGLPNLGSQKFSCTSESAAAAERTAKAPRPELLRASERSLRR